MQPGINTDIEFEGRVFHMQTEDSGKSNPVVVTLLFQSGKILASRKTSYADILSAHNLPTLVREIMSEQHRAVVEELRSGKFREFVESKKLVSESSSPRGASAPIAGAKLPDPPRPSTGRRTKSLDQLVSEYLAKKSRRDPAG